MIIAQPKERIAEFVQTHGGGGPFLDYNALGLVRNDQLVCGVIYQHWTSYDVDVHMAAIPGGHWGNRELLYAAFDYPFTYVNRITAKIPQKNVRSRRLAEHLGFKMEGTMRHATADGDVSVYGLLKEDCRWHIGSVKRLRLAA